MTGVAVLLVAWDVDVSSSLVVAAGIVVLLTGLSLVGAVEDAISGFPVTAAARAFEVVTLTAGIVVGIVSVLDLAHRAQFPLDVVDASPTTVPVLVQLAASAGIAGCGHWPRMPARAPSASPRWQERRHGRRSGRPARWQVAPRWPGGSRLSSSGSARSC